MAPPDPAKPDLLRLLVSTDNHVGVWEDDEVRRDDSFRTLDEIFERAGAERCDGVLLGGDLFHQNKPSRQTLTRAMAVLNRHCLGDGPVALQVLSRQRDNFVAGRVNFESPDHNVRLPVFTIHGNHDDPAGEGNLSAIDVLSECRLVNYFGKTMIPGQGMGKIVMRPVLLRKGRTKLALYGLGNLRDERLARLFQTPGCIEWQLPRDTPEHPAQEWHCVLLLHQNRVPHGQAGRGTLQREWLPGFLDVVVWGHEHECLPGASRLPTEKGGEDGLTVLQPGSSVATSLSEGEAAPKHFVILEFERLKFRALWHRLQTVRPFQFQQVVLAEQDNLDTEDNEAVAACLEARVEALVAKAAREAGERARGMLPLVRLRVDYSGCTTVHTKQFGQRLVGRVANPHDVLHWFKRRAPKAADAGRAAAAAPVRAPDEASMEEQLAAQLTAAMRVAPRESFLEALHEYVDKEEKLALNRCLDAAAGDSVAAASLAGDGAARQGSAVTDALAAHAERRMASAREQAASRRARGAVALPAPSAAGTAQAPAAAGGDLSDGEAAPPAGRRAPARGRGRGRARGGGRQATLQDSGMGALTLTSAGRSTPASPTSRSRSRRPASAAATRRLTASRADDSGSDAADDLDLEAVEESSEASDAAPPARKRARQGRLPTQRRQGARGGTPSQAPPQQPPGTQASAPIDLGSDDDEPLTAPPATARRRLPASLARGGRVGGRRGRGR